jgi:hypothetical protein
MRLDQCNSNVKLSKIFWINIKKSIQWRLQIVNRLFKQKLDKQYSKKLSKVCKKWDLKRKIIRKQFSKKNQIPNWILLSREEKLKLLIKVKKRY